MFKRFILLLAAVLMVGMVGYAATPAAPVAKKVAADRVEGTVQSVDAPKNSITVMVGTDTRTFTYGPDTVFTMNGKKGTVDLKGGETVSIHADSKNVIRMIDVKSGAGH